MKLFFVCPSENKGFWSAEWSIPAPLAETCIGRGKVLQGSVLVPCPVCGENHTYRADELSCPFQPAENGGDHD